MGPLDADKLWAFLAVVDRGGFSAAARALGKTQSSVSQAVAQLERTIGQRLFVRDGRRTRPTDAGRLLRVHAARAWDELRQARARLDALGALDAGELTIGTSDTFACHLLPGVFARFRDRHPRIELRLVNRPSPAVAALVANGDADIGVISLPLPEGLRDAGRRAADRVRLEPLAPHDDVLIMPPGHALAARTRVTIAAIAAYPLLLLDASTGTRAFLDEAFARAGVRPRVAMEMNSVEVCKRLVELGFGLSIVPAVAVARERAARSLASAKLVGLPARRQVGLVSAAAAPASRAAEAFAEIARELLRP